MPSKIWRFLQKIINCSKNIAMVFAEKLGDLSTIHEILPLTKVADSRSRYSYRLTDDCISLRPFSGEALARAENKSHILRTWCGE